LSRHLSPTVTPTTEQPASNTLRPGWTPAALPDAGAYFEDDWLTSLTIPEPGAPEVEPLGRETVQRGLRDGAGAPFTKLARVRNR
jgi:hypothetical protein